MTFEYRNQQFTYIVSRSERKTLGICVHPDLTIEVRAPKESDIEDIRERVQKRRAWIVRKLREFEAYHPIQVPKVYKSGATHLYLGRQYRLKVENGDRNHVKVSGSELLVTVYPTSTPHRALWTWYAERADEWFPKILDEVFPRFERYGISKPTLKHKFLQKRWGSCKVINNRLLLNTELIMAPRAGIEYVVTHELTHLIHPHHTAEFYGVMDTVMPDWRMWKRRLEESLA